MKGMVLCTLLAGMSTLWVAAQNPQEQRTAGTGVVEGIVTRAGTSDPIAGVKVSLSGGPFDPVALQRLLSFFAARGVTVSPPANGQAEEKFLQVLTDSAAARGVSPLNPDIRDALEQFHSANNARFAAASDSAGHFAITNVLPGRYTIHTQRDSFLEDTTDPTLSEAVIVAAAQTATVNLSMLRGATISGRVTDSAGQPLANTTVQAFPTSFQNGFPVLQASVTKTTDDRGEYRIFWLPPGEYLIAAQVQPATSGTSGITSSSSANPVRSFYPGTTDVSTAIPLVVQWEAQLSGIDIGVQPVQTYRISGEIRSSAGPAISGQPNRIQVGSARIMLAARDPGVPEEGGPTALSEIPLRPSGKQLAGTFEIKGVLPGAYDLRVSTDDLNPEGGAQGLLAFASIPIDINHQDVTGLSLEIFSNVRVKGTVSVDGHAPGQTPVRIALQVDGSASKRPSYQGLAKRPVLANDQDGTFTVPGVAAGRFHILAGPGLPPNFYIADVLQRGSVFDSGFEVGGEPPDPIQVIVRSGAGTIEGIVRGANGKPMSGATIVLIPPMTRRQNHALYRSGTSDANGHFKIEGAAPGNYDLFAWQNMPDGAYFNSRFVSRFEDRARPINVAESSRTNVNLTAFPATGQ